MNDPRRSWYRLVVLCSMLMLSGCAGIFYGDEIEERPPQDVAIAMRVKAALIEQEHIGAAAIYIEATDGVVRLSGFVDNSAQRQLAGEVAQQVSGVKKVMNVIAVK